MKTKYIMIERSPYRPNSYNLEIMKEGDGGKWSNIGYETLVDKLMGFLIEARAEKRERK